MHSLKETYTLINGVTIPKLGLGTFLNTDAATCYDTVKEALRIGYRLFDTASVYGNEEFIGRAIADSGIERKDIFIVSKVPGYVVTREDVFREFERSLERLKTEYLDLYMIHWQPYDFSRLQEIWSAFEELYRKRKVRAIGVCNLSLYYLDRLIASAAIAPMACQVELHPLLNQRVLVKYCRQRDIQVMSYGPFAKGHVFEDEILKNISRRKNVSVAQLILEWGLTRDIVMIPKTVHAQRLVENQELQFTLNEADMEEIRSAQTGLRYYRDPDNNIYTAENSIMHKGEEHES